LWGGGNIPELYSTADSFPYSIEAAADADEPGERSDNQAGRRWAYQAMK
jgi:hypothetical protein